MVLRRQPVAGRVQGGRPDRRQPVAASRPQGRRLHVGLGQRVVAEKSPARLSVGPQVVAEVHGRRGVVGRQRHRDDPVTASGPVVADGVGRPHPEAPGVGRRAGGVHQAVAPGIAGLGHGEGVRHARDEVVVLQGQVAEGLVPPDRPAAGIRRASEGQAGGLDGLGKGHRQRPVERHPGLTGRRLGPEDVGLGVLAPTHHAYRAAPAVGHEHPAAVALDQGHRVRRGPGRQAQRRLHRFSEGIDDAYQAAVLVGVVDPLNERVVDDGGGRVAGRPQIDGGHRIVGPANDRQAVAVVAGHVDLVADGAVGHGMGPGGHPHCVQEGVAARVQDGHLVGAGQADIDLAAGLVGRQPALVVHPGHPQGVYEAGPLGHQQGIGPAVHRQDLVGRPVEEQPPLVVALVVGQDAVRGPVQDAEAHPGGVEQVVARAVLQVRVALAEDEGGVQGVALAVVDVDVTAAGHVDPVVGRVVGGVGRPAGHDVSVVEAGVDDGQHRVRGGAVHLAPGRVVAEFVRVVGGGEGGVHRIGEALGLQARVRQPQHGRRQGQQIRSSRHGMTSEVFSGRINALPEGCSFSPTGHDV